MAKLLQRLQDPSKSGVYRTSSIDPIVDAVRGSKLGFARISFAGKETIQESIARTLGFPEWFGGNWDALEDCLSDLSWREAPGHVLAFEGFQPLAPDAVNTLIDVLRSAAEFWAGQGEPFFAVFIDAERKITLPDLFNEG
jgi:hypothetical protein